MSRFWFIEDVNLFRILCPHLFEQYKDKHNFKQYKKNDSVYIEGDSAEKIFLIANGKIRVGYYNEDGKEILKAILRKGEIFGELAILGEKERSEFARVIDNNTILCPMSVEVLKSLMYKNENFSLKIYKLIGFRLKKIERRLNLILFKDVKTRLLEFLDEMKEDFGVKKDGVVIIRHPYTQRDIADLIGSTRQTVNSLLNDLYNEGIITLKRGKIYLREN